MVSSRHIASNEGLGYQSTDRIMTVLYLFFAILAIVCLQISFARAISSTPLKVVSLGYATYQSDLSLEDGVTSFLGVRYAAPPTGKSSSVTFLIVFSPLS